VNAYIVRKKYGYSALLVFARTAQESRKISFSAGQDWEMIEEWEWTDWVAKRIWNLPAHLAELDTGEPQIVADPPACERCELWGGFPTENGCSFCEEEDA